VVQSPQQLVDLFPAKDGEVPGTIKASYANFGLIPYGHSMVINEKTNLPFKILTNISF